jgi:putative aldouronate transport system substrate-binding protein
VPDARIVMFGGLKNKSGEFSYISAQAVVPVGFYNMVPKTAKNPGAVVKYVDWLVGDGGDVLWWGFEGEHYVVKDGIKVAKDSVYNDKSINWMRAWMVPVYNMTADRDPKVQKALLETRFGGQIGKDYRDGILLLESRFKPGILLESVVKSASKYSSALSRLQTDGINRIVSGPADQVEAAYKKLVDEYMAAGGKEVIEESKAAFAKMKR